MRLAPRGTLQAVPADVPHSLLLRIGSVTGALRQTEAAGSTRREFRTAENRGHFAGPLSVRVCFRAPMLGLDAINAAFRGLGSGT